MTKNFIYSILFGTGASLLLPIQAKANLSCPTPAQIIQALRDPGNARRLNVVNGWVPKQGYITQSDYLTIAGFPWKYRGESVSPKNKYTIAQIFEKNTRNPGGKCNIVTYQANFPTWCTYGTDNTKDYNNKCEDNGYLQIEFAG